MKKIASHGISYLTYDLYKMSSSNLEKAFENLDRNSLIVVFEAKCFDHEREMANLCMLINCKFFCPHQ